MSFYVWLQKKKTRKILTHKPHLVSIVDERYVENKTGEYKQDCVDVLQLWVFDDWRNHQIGGYYQNQYRNDERHLKRED